VRFDKLRSYLDDSLDDQFSALFCESFSQFVRESVLFLLRASQGLDALLQRHDYVGEKRIVSEVAQFSGKWMEPPSNSASKGW
jgi:hypothetical protein